MIEMIPDQNDIDRRNDKFNMAIADALTARRVELGIVHREAASLLGLGTSGRLSDYENGVYDFREPEFLAEAMRCLLIYSRIERDRECAQCSQGGNDGT